MIRPSTRRSTLWVLGLSLLVWALPTLAEKQKLGAAVGEQAPVAIAKILESPDSFAGKEVEITGKVCGVCLKAGCWMELEQDGARLRVKVNDGDLVFPPEAMGQKAVARGKVKILEMSREQYVGWQKHLAEELGQKFDEASIGNPPYRIVQLDGLGASIGE